MDVIFFFLVEILRLPGCPVAHQTPPPRWLISYTSHKPWGFNWNLLVCLIRLINLRLTISRIHCIKESQSFSHCKSFDQPTMELLNNYKFVCLVYLLKFEEFEGFWVVLHAPKVLKVQSQNTKRNLCSRLATTYQSGQKNRNGKRLTDLFCVLFY